MAPRVNTGRRLLPPLELLAQGHLGRLSSSPRATLARATSWREGAGRRRCADPGEWGEWGERDEWGAWADWEDRGAWGEWFEWGEWGEWSEWADSG